MGRETKFLLTLLGLLVGVFVGVLSLKLFVPRPPAGTGPDVHADIALAETQDLVEPPALVPPPATLPAVVDEAYGSRTSRFSAQAEAVVDPPRDPFVRQAAFETPLPTPPAAAPDLPPTPTVPPPDTQATPVPPGAPATFPIAPAALPAGPPATPAAAPEPGGGMHVAGPGDSWWSLAEQAYGDGRLYRALFAWNKALDPRVSLTPGTRLQIPPAPQLHAAWPALVPRE